MDKDQTVCIEIKIVITDWLLQDFLVMTGHYENFSWHFSFWVVNKSFVKTWHTKCSKDKNSHCQRNFVFWFWLHCQVCFGSVNTTLNDLFPQKWMLKITKFYFHCIISYKLLILSVNSILAGNEDFHTYSIQ